MFKNKTVLITGGSGSWGNELTRQLLDKNTKKIIIFSRGELAQVTMKRKFCNDRLKFVIGDVRDDSAVDKLFNNNDIDYVYHCFPEGTQVICENGVKNIEDILVGDTVFSSDGKSNEVTNLMRRRYKGDLVEISAYHSNIKFKSTAGHPHLVWKPSKSCSKTCRTKCTPACNNKNKGACPEHYKKDSVTWVNAENIEKGDYVVIPRLKIKDFSTDYSCDMMRLFGYYLAEGCSSKYAVRFTFSNKEESYLADVENIIFKNFDKKGSRYYSDNNSCTITVCGKDIVKKFAEFGIYSYNKRIPKWIFKLTDFNKIEQLLLGYFRGDGCYSNGKMSTVSKYLAYQLRLLFGTIGIPTGLSKYKGRPFRKDSICRDNYEISISKLNSNNNFFISSAKNSYKTFVTEDYIFYLVKSVKRNNVNTVVYNLTVNGNNTYNVHGYATHNCAALKHVPVCENQPQEAIKTNINGTVNIIDSATKNGVEKVIDVSSDKACSPTNLYGMTKAVGEKLIIQANTLTDKTNFVCVRGGNVLGSNGSVVPFFIDQIKKSNKVTITDNRMTRFFLTLSDAISLLFQAAENSVGGETYIMNMPSFHISDLAQVLIDYYGNDNTTMKEIGIREGEKLHEVLISEHESHRSYVLNEDYYAILPELNINKDYSSIISLKKVPFEEFSSSDNVKDKKYLYNLLMKGGFLKK